MDNELTHAQLVDETGPTIDVLRRNIRIARKLAVLLHRLWVSGEQYEPLRHTRATMACIAA